MRQSSLRNQRSKGLRMKQVLQVCVLAAICFWLLYQLKHSYDKKRAIEVMNATISERVEVSQSDLFKLGRKDLPNVEATGGIGIGTNVKEDDTEEVEEDEEPETKHESGNEESRGTGDEEFDETEEQDQEKVDEDAEHGDESAEEEDKNAVIDGAHSLDEEEHEGDSREAREENYKKDDASSAVRHDDGEHVGGSREAREEHYTKYDGSSTVRPEVETMETVFGHDGARSKVENIEYKERDVESTANGAVDSSKVNGDSDMRTGSSEVANGNASIVPLGENVTVLNDDLLKNDTSVKDRGHGHEVPNLEVQSLSNSTSAGYGSPRELQTDLTTSAGNNNQAEVQANTTADVLINQTEIQNISTEVDTAISCAPPQNGTVKLDPVQDLNATFDLEIAGEVKTDMADVAIKLPEKSYTTVNGDAGQGGSGEDDSSQMEKLNTNKNSVAAQGELSHPLQLEKSNTSEDGDAQGEIIDPSHKTVKAEEREAPMDLSTE